MSFCSSTAWNQANGSITLIPIEKNQTLRIRNGHFTIQRKKLNKFNYLPPFLIVPNCTRTLIYLIWHFPDNKKKPSSHMNPMNLMWWKFELLQKIIIGSKDNGGGDGWYFVSSVTGSFEMLPQRAIWEVERTGASGSFDDPIHWLMNLAECDRFLDLQSHWLRCYFSICSMTSWAC